jgi:hypothetical protein
VKGALGLDRFLVVNSGGATLLAWDGPGWHPLGTFRATIDPGTNTVTTTIPSTVLPVVGAAPWKVVGLLGLMSSSWMIGGPIYDLAFVGGELPASWQDAKQGDVLAGRVPAASAEVTVDVAKVRNRATSTPTVGSGYHTFLYHSGLKLAEGTGPVSLEGANSLYYLGPYQPYMVWVPKNLPPGPAPLLTMLHGALGNHEQAVFDGAPPAGAAGFFTGSTTFNVPAVVVTPLGRGETDYYWGIAEQDILDVIKDARQRFDIDPNRMVLSGISLGGQGTWRFSELHPDMFSAIVPMIAPSTFPLEQVVGPLRHIFPNAEENVTDLPVRVLAGRLDPLSDAIAVDGQDTDFVNATRLGIDMRYWQLLLRNHQVVPAAENCVLLEALTHRRNENPARVVYTTEPGLEMSDPATGLNLRYRSAYWVTDLEARTGDSTPKATVDVTSLARADRTNISTVQRPAFGQNIATPGDVCGTPGSKVQTQDAWYYLENRVAPGPTQPTLNGLQLKLTNVAATTLDLARASVRTTEPVHLSVTGDGRAAVVLTGPWRGPVTVTRDGAALGTITPKDDAVSLDADFTGTHTFVLTPR